MYWKVLMVGFLFLFLITLVGSRGKTIIVDDDDGAWAHYDSLGEAVGASSEGDTIRVNTGNYTEYWVQDGPVQITHPLTIIGNGSSSFIELEGNGDIISIKSDDVYVEGLRLRGLYVNGDGMSIINSDNVTIESCTFDRFGRNGIYLDSSSSNVLVSNCSFIDCGFYERVSNVANAGTSSVVNCTTNGKLIHRYYGQTDIVVPANAGQAIVINCSNVLVDGIVTVDANSGLQAYYSSNVTLTNSTFSDQMTGAWIEYCDNVTITDCTILRMYCYGLALYELTDLYVTNCSIYGPGESFTISDSENAFFENMSFKDTELMHCYNISIVHMSNFTFTNFTDEIRIDRCEEVSLNQWTFDVFHGLCFEDVGKATISNSIFPCNGTGGWPWAIQIDNIDEIYVLNSTLTESYTTGIEWEYGGGNLTLDNVTISHCKEGPLLLRALDSVRLINVLIHNNSRGWKDAWINIGEVNIFNSTFSNNSVTGVRLFSDDTLTKSNFYGNNDTPVIVSGNNNSITWNTFKQNIYWGISVNGYGNTIHHNKFIDNGNSPQINDEGSPQNGTVQNHYDDGSEGNWWSDYEGVDSDDNGIGDSPYQIKPEDYISDRYPLMIYLSVPIPEKITLSIALDSNPPLEGKYLIIFCEVNSSSKYQFSSIYLYVDDELIETYPYLITKGVSYFTFQWKAVKGTHDLMVVIEVPINIADSITVKVNGKASSDSSTSIPNTGYVLLAVTTVFLATYRRRHY